jgi:hypothetical protein
MSARITRSRSSREPRPHLVPLAAQQALRQLGNSGRLIARRLVLRNQLEALDGRNGRPLRRHEDGGIEERDHARRIGAAILVRHRAFTRPGAP